MGEYGLTKAIQSAGYNIATLMSMCATSALQMLHYWAKPGEEAHFYKDFF